MSWIIFAVISSLGYSIGPLLDRFTLSKKIKSVVTYLFYVNAIFFIAALFIIIIFTPRLPNIKEIILIAGLIIFDLFGSLLYYKTVSKEEASRVIPLYYSYPILIALFAAFFLGESITTAKIIAIILAVIGAVLISYKPGEKKKFVHYSIIGMVFISTIIFSLSDVYLKYLTDEISLLNIFVWQHLIFFPITFILFIIFGRKKDKISNLRKKDLLIPVIAIGVIEVTAYLFGITAVSKTMITNVGVVSTIEPMFIFIWTLLLSIFIPRLIKERFDKKNLLTKLAATILIICGGLIVALT